MSLAIDREASVAIVRPFTYGATLDGYEVVDVSTGRSMGFEYDTAQQANGKAQYLNEVAKAGPRALARALRAAD